MSGIRFGAVHGALIVGMFAGRLAAQSAPANIAETPFPRPSGPHAIGTYDWLWIDERRGELYTKTPDDRRRVPVQVWYPADPAPGAAMERYIIAPAEFGPNSFFKAMEHVKTNAVAGAPMAAADRKYPVLVYNPGAGANRFSATFVVEQLASQGYVVFSIDHPGLNRSVLFSDGTGFKADTLTPPARDPKDDARASSAKSMNFLNSSVFPIWIDDSRFVLDRIEALNRAAGPFHQRLDLDRIGMLGWSFGGATAVEMARIDRRVKAAVNHDGRLFGGARSEPVGRPFMLVHHGIDDAAAAPDSTRPMLRDMMKAIRDDDSTARARATGDWYDLIIARTNHGHFSDLPLFMPQFKDTTLLAGPRSHEIIVAYTVAFFDQYLRGKPSALLDAPSAGYPDVTFLRSARMR